MANHIRLFLGCQKAGAFPAGSSVFATNKFGSSGKMSKKGNPRCADRDSRMLSANQ